MKLACRIAFCLLIVFVAFRSQIGAQESLNVIRQDVAPREMMQQWLMQQAQQRFEQWNAAYEQRNSLEQIADYQQRQRQFFIDQLGGLPERTALNPQITGTIDRDGYRVEKILFESQPGLHVSAALFLPADTTFQPPYPAALVVCGHSAQAKAYPAYQTACALLAKHGVAALIIDPVGQGERYQHLNPDGSVALASTTAGHSLLGLGSMLLGQNTARFEVWDGMRAIDYLQSRDDIDANKIGCMGNSGGGTQTAYLMALDDRIKAASPACYITNFEQLLNTIGPQDAEQNIFGQLKFGMDHADYLMMRAPTPILICCATNDFFNIEGTWSSFRRAKRLYGRMGHPERIALVETDNQHGWHQPLREAAVAWMVRWLGGRDEVIVEEGIELIDPQELWATPEGQVLQLPGARSAFELNQQENKRLATTREKRWQDPDQALQRVRELAGIRPLKNLAEPEIYMEGEIDRDAYTISQLTFSPEKGIILPALLYRPKVPIGTATDWTIFIHEAGKQGTNNADNPESMVKQGRTVLAVDLRGTGETKPENAVWYDARFGEDGKHLMMAYLLGRSYVGLRAEDLLVCARWANEQRKPDTDKLELISHGEVGVSALHAAALEPELFGKIRIDDCLQSWESIVRAEYSQDQLVNVVHGALTAYDLVDLANSLGSKLELTNPVDASAK